MNYLNDMMAVLRLEAGVWSRIGQSRRALHYTVANVLGLGLVYGFSVLMFGRRLLEPGATFNPLLIMMVGVSVAFLIHGGAALYIWMFCRGMGGTTAFFPFYLHIGVATIGFWLAAPAVALAQTGARGVPLGIYLITSLFYALAVLFPAVRQAADLSNRRMAIAAALTLIFVGCLLYLWAF
ncbi:MAG: hypothetical protein PHF66_13045 [Desulfobacteraceae bacterium]|jgi:hypothetical protein|nr:hypothetical protein [Desulfobacteraceae bacterium]MDD3992088.1 hypothetical protein [Desulfobacteraceae bacterium]